MPQSMSQIARSAADQTGRECEPLRTPPSHRVQKAAQARLVSQWRALLGLLIALPLMTLAAHRSTLWIGTAFPGFILMENAVIASVGGHGWPPEIRAR